jgi:MFS family permease
MMIGFLGFLAGQMLLVTAPEQGYPLLIISVVLEACSFAAVSPLVDKLLVLTVDPHERARIQSLLYMGVILLTAPFGWIAGTLSAAQKDFPFLLNMALCAIGIALAYMAGRSAQRRTAAETAEATA